MSDFTIIVTDAGRTALVNAANTGTAPVTITHCGVSATAVAATPSTLALPGEIKRIATLSGDVVADDTIHMIVRDESVDVYALNSIALYLADGTLFAIYGQATPIMEKSSLALLQLAVDVRFADIDAAALTFGDTNFLNPPATTERQGVVQLATIPGAKAGLDALRALTPASAKAAILDWLLAQDGSGSGIDSDLLDGQHGSFYTDIAARLGFSPLNAALYTAADVLAKLLTVDGAGSGIDADMLDGQHGSYYADIAARLGFNPLNAALYTAADVLAKLLTVDGAGSGIDADMLDGLQAALFARLDINAPFAGLVSASGFSTTGQVKAVGGVVVGAGTSPYLYNEGNIFGIRVGVPGAYTYLRVGPNSLTLNDEEAVRMIDKSVGDGGSGYRMYTDGYRECWGITSFNADQTKTVNYPFTFASWTHAYLEGANSNISQLENGPSVSTTSKTGFTATNPIGELVWVRWHAFGY